MSPYVEPPTIPEGMTVAEYRRARQPRSKPLLPHLIDWLSHLAGVREEAVAPPAAITLPGSPRMLA